ncbi:MAG: hypothetical protein AAGA96_07050 [Verrucomicrobiota bacterium]
MKNRFTRLLHAVASLVLASPFGSDAQAQKKARDKTAHLASRQDFQLPANPLPVGESGIMWYTTWETALAEAKRSNRPLFFMAAAAGCSGISGIF